MTAIQKLYPFPNAVDGLLSGPARGFTREFHNLDEGELKSLWNRKGHVAYVFGDVAYKLQPGVVHIFRSEQTDLLYPVHKDMDMMVDPSIVESRMRFAQKVSDVLQAENADAMGNALNQLQGVECSMKTIVNDLIKSGASRPLPSGLDSQLEELTGLQQAGRDVSLATGFFNLLKKEAPHGPLLREALVKFCQRYLAGTVDHFEKGFKGGPGFVPRAQAPRGYDGAS